MKLNRSLLAALDETANPPADLHSCLNVHGLYSTLHFVLRLSPEIHRVLAATPSGIYNGTQISFEQIQAFSTYLHETVHWWQHIGSTAGLMLSLSHPVQSHGNYTHLKTFLREIGPKKSILKFNLNKKQQNKATEAGSRATNIVVNNFKDISFFQTLATRPDLFRERNMADDPYFECAGHSYHIMYANVLRLLIDQFDPQCAFLPDPRTWEPAFDKLKNEKNEGFYLGSRIAIPPFGLREIFEGQARFIQLQYLHFGSNGKFNWDDARNFGMLGKVYVAAFEQFLKQAEAQWPGKIDSPLVALFLAICDMTLNSGAGFPLPLVFPETFLSDNDPGTRFVFLCRMVALKAPHLKSAISSYSRDEYIQVTEELCQLLITPSPLSIAQQVTEWSKTKSRLTELMEEDRVFRFSPQDMPARLLFARYINFNRDKFQSPEMLCWPGAWFAGKRCSGEGMALFDRNRALFTDKEHDDGIFPALLPDKDEKTVQDTFNKFYGWIANYELISQWIAQTGPFDYGYEWLSKTNKLAEVRNWAAGGFEHIFGVHPDRFELL